MKKVIIIGSGMGGLIAGNLLAGKGHKVTIFESHSLPGGYTAGFYRQGFYFESGTLSFEASASVFKAMQDIGVRKKLNFVRQKMRFVGEAFDAIPESYADYKKMYYAGFPDQKENLDAYFAALDEMAGVMGDMDKPMPYLYSGLKLAASMLSYIPVLPRQMKLTKKYDGVTSSEFVARYFPKDSRLYRLFCGSGYPDMPAMFYGAGMSSMYSDYWTVQDGMQAWADVLAESFKKAGGDLKLNAYIEKIITKDGAAVGVSCKNTVYEADYVISASDYKKTLLKLLDDPALVPQETREKLSDAAVSEGFFTVYLGLNMSNEELSKFMRIPHVFLVDAHPDYDIYDSRDAEFFSKTPPGLYSPSMVNPRHAPEGKSSLMLQTTVPYRWMNNWGGGDRAEYHKLKNKAMEAMIDSTARLIPGLRDAIEYKDAATPLTYERYTHNTDGASSAWSWNPRKKFYKDIMSVNIQTPVKNLLIGSCWAMQVGGIPGAVAAAYQCAHRVK